MSENDYFEMIGKKLLHCLRLPVRWGAFVGNGKSDQVDALFMFGWNCGLAFQVIDDLLDVTAKEEVLGKNIWKDIREHKLGNLVILYSLKDL